MIAECCIMLKTASKGGVQYSWMVESDYADDDEYDWLQELKPDPFFTKAINDVTRTYLLVLCDSHLPRYALKQKMQDYTDWIAQEEWEGNIESDEPPVVLFAFESMADMLYAKHRARMLLEDEPDDVQTLFRVATYDSIRIHGVAGRIWEEI